MSASTNHDCGDSTVRASAVFAAPSDRGQNFEKLERLLVEERKTNVFAVFFHFIFTIYNRGARAILSLL
jgi:hypothetical protein